MGDTEPDECLVRLSDHALSHLATLTEQEQCVAIENLTRILSDILSYTEAVRMGNLSFLLNETPSIAILGDQLMGRKSNIFAVEFESYSFQLVSIRGRVIVIEFANVVCAAKDMFYTNTLQ